MGMPMGLIVIVLTVVVAEVIFTVQHRQLTEEMVGTPVASSTFPRSSSSSSHRSLLQLVSHQ